MSNKSQKIQSIDQTVSDDINNLNQNELKDLISFAENGSEKIRDEAVIVLFRISQEKPVLLTTALPALKSIIEDPNAMDWVRQRASQTYDNILEDPTVQETISQKNGRNEGTQSNDIHSKSARAESSTIAVSRLKGRERHFYDVTQFMKPDEQPLFLFALTKSMLAANGSVVVDKHGSDMTLVENNITGSLLISDYGIRILTEEGRWSITYQSITGVDTEKKPTPTLRIVSAGEVYKIRVAKSIHEQSQVFEAAKLIRNVINSI